MNNQAGKKVLLLCHYYEGCAGAILDHIFSFPTYSENDYYVLPIYGDLPEWLNLSRFDALVIHYSLIAACDNYISPTARRCIREFSGFKAAFVQDDYRWINNTVSALAYMGIHALFPLTGPEIIDYVYSPMQLPGVRKTTVLAGYVPQHLVSRAVKSYAERKIDVGYRARKLPAWMGSHTLQKWQIAEKFLADAPRYGLNLDISCREEDRIYGDHWIEFLTNCKATLGTESGASVCDFTGNIQKNVEAHLLRHPNESFDKLRDLYFKEEDGRIMMNVISPRCFESAALRTLMILYEGNYSGVLTPWRHYVPLKQDHSNMDEVVDVLRSEEVATKIIQQAYEEVAKNEKYSYKAMVHLVDSIMQEEWRSAFVPATRPYLHEEFEWLKIHFPAIQAWHTKKYDYYFSTSKLLGSNLSYEVPDRNNNTLMINFGEAIIVKHIAVCWDTACATPPDTYEIVGRRWGRKAKRWTQKNNGVAFHQVDFSSINIVDAIEVHGAKPDESCRPLAIFVIGDAPGVTTFMFVRKHIVYLIQRIWKTCPERVRVILRPIARAVSYFIQNRLLKSRKTNFRTRFKTL